MDEYIEDLVSRQDSLSKVGRVLQRSKFVGEDKGPGRLLQRKQVPNHYGNERRYIVLVAWKENLEWGPEYVTWMEDERGNRSSGHYFVELGDALDDFEARD